MHRLLAVVVRWVVLQHPRSVVESGAWEEEELGVGNP